MIGPKVRMIDVIYFSFPYQRVSRSKSLLPRDAEMRDEVGQTQMLWSQQHGGEAVSPDPRGQGMLELRGELVDVTNA
jgi:hypothetical protein